MKPLGLLKIMKIKVKKLHKEAIVPHFVHDGDVGMDLYSVEDLILKPGQRYAVATGLSIDFPHGYAGLICDKSGLAVKHGITTIAGVIDPEYRGEWKVVLLNASDEDYYIKKGEKVAQVLFPKIEYMEVEEVDELQTNTSRGDGGFGSTGVKKK